MTNNNNKETIVIFTAKMARKLLKNGETIVDIKPDKLSATGERSVFIFKRTNTLMNIILADKENNKESEI